MVLRITSDPEEVRALLDRRLQVDPVRATVLGTIRLALDLDEAQCWCAATLDGSAVAVRSNQSYPVVLNGDWPVDDVDQLATAVGSLPALVGISGAPATVRSVAARIRKSWRGNWARIITSIPTRAMARRSYRSSVARA